MKVGQNTIVRWVAKLVAKEEPSRKDQKRALRVLDTDQLRHVSGGTGSSTATPTKGW